MTVKKALPYSFLNPLFCSHPSLFLHLSSALMNSMAPGWQYVRCLSFGLSPCGYSCHVCFAFPCPITPTLLPLSFPSGNRDNVPPCLLRIPGNVRPFRSSVALTMQRVSRCRIGMASNRTLQKHFPSPLQLRDFPSTTHHWRFKCPILSEGKNG